MAEQKNYKKTLIACYLGFVTQAISANFAPLLFLTFRDTYGITLEKIAMIPLVFYLTQLLVDLAATVFPVILVISLLILKKSAGKTTNSAHSSDCL